jgi:hypothetical protein
MTPTQAEYVTFRLAPGTDPAAFLAAARATDAALASHPGYLARHLSEGPDGQWTDCVLWSDATAAHAAAAAAMSDPRFGPFMAAIAPESMVMRHETLHWQKG